MAKTTKLAFLVQRAGYKCENPKLALTHAISSQTVDIYLEDGDAVVPVVAFVGEGVLNCKNSTSARWRSTASRARRTTSRTRCSAT